jgi:hypothetical protein
MVGDVDTVNLSYAAVFLPRNAKNSATAPNPNNRIPVLPPSDKPGVATVFGAVDVPCVAAKAVTAAVDNVEKIPRGDVDGAAPPLPVVAAAAAPNADMFLLVGVSIQSPNEHVGSEQLIGFCWASRQALLPV